MVKILLVRRTFFTQNWHSVSSIQQKRRIFQEIFKESFFIRIWKTWFEKIGWFSLYALRERWVRPPFLPGRRQRRKHALLGMCAPKAERSGQPHGRRWQATPGTGLLHPPSISAWWQRWGRLKPPDPALGAHITGRAYFPLCPRLGRKGAPHPPCTPCMQGKSPSFFGLWNSRDSSVSRLENSWRLTVTPSTDQQVSAIPYESFSPRPVWAILEDNGGFWMHPELFQKFVENMEIAVDVYGWSWTSQNCYDCLDMYMIFQ